MVNTTTVLALREKKKQKWNKGYWSRFAVSRLMDFSASFLEGVLADPLDGVLRLVVEARGSLLMRLWKNSESTLCSFCPPFPREGVPSAGAADAPLAGLGSGVAGVAAPRDDRLVVRIGVLGKVSSADSGWPRKTNGTGHWCQRAESRESKHAGRVHLEFQERIWRER